MTEQVVQSKRRGFEVTIEGLPPIVFLGWRSTHAKVDVAGEKHATWRAVLIAQATAVGVSGGLPVQGRAILRPGDRFDRETGKRIALARLVEQLVPLASAYTTALSDKAVRVEQARLKALRSRLFREIWKRTHAGKLPAKPRGVFFAPLGAAIPRAVNWFYSRYPESAPIAVQQSPEAASFPAAYMNAVPLSPEAKEKSLKEKA